MTERLLHKKPQNDKIIKAVYSKLEYIFIKNRTMDTVISYVLGAVVGLAWGFLVGYLKYTVLWKTTIKADKELTQGAMYKRLGIGYAVNVATLLLVFLLRNVLPFEFAMVLIGAAVGLSVSGKLAPMTEIMTHVKKEEKLHD